jgi:hypothetical protein
VSLIPIFLEVGDDHGDLGGFFVVADSAEKVGQGEGGECREPFAFVFLALGRGVDKVEREFVEQDEDGLVFEERGPLLF